MAAFRRMLGSKIHRATITQADLDYEGSLTIPPSLLALAEIAESEAVQVWNVTRGTRFETYAIRGEEGGWDICANGAAAHLAKPGDIVIVAAFVLVAEADVAHHQPTVVFVDEHNHPLARRPEVPGPRRA
jgi:aspartate 1-decarboxylase